ncbi:MAG: hypothetical protein ABSD75_09070 [Terriglobales bacterium]|jgi:hypothetical protein
MSIEEVSAEQLAELFHHYHQALAPDFGCITGAPRESWEQISQPEKNRMVAAARLTILEVAATERKPKTEDVCHPWPGGVGLLRAAASNSD